MRLLRSNCALLNKSNNLYIYLIYGIYQISNVVYFNVLMFYDYTSHKDVKTLIVSFKNFHKNLNRFVENRMISSTHYVPHSASDCCLKTN